MNACVYARVNKVSAYKRIRATSIPVGLDGDAYPIDALICLNVACIAVTSGMYLNTRAKLMHMS